MAKSNTPKTDTHAGMALAAMRLMNGTGGGLPRRRLDSGDGTTFAGLVDAVLAGWRVERAERAAQQAGG